MNEIYWITRLGSLGETCCVLMIGSIIVAVFMLVMSPLIIDAYKDLSEKGQSTFKKILKSYFFVLCLSALGTFFIPTQKELFLIYGIGGTIDYIKSNDKAKQLPDKVVDALTRYVDNIEKEDKDNNN